MRGNARFRPDLRAEIFYGRFRAAAFAREREEGGPIYHHPEPVESPEEIVAAIERARVQTGFDGKLISVLYDSETLERSFHPHPELTRSESKRYFNAMVEREKSFDAPARSTFRSIGFSGVGAISMIESIEARYFDSLSSRLLDGDLHLWKFCSPASIIANLAIDSDDGVALISAIGDRLKIHILARSGVLLLERPFNQSWRVELGRESFVREIERSILFAHQRYGVSVKRIGALGSARFFSALQPGASTGQVEETLDSTRAFERARDELNLKPFALEVGDVDRWWLDRLGAISTRDDGNFSSPHVLTIANRSRAEGALRAMAIFFWLIALASIARVEYALLTDPTLDRRAREAREILKIDLAVKRARLDEAREKERLGALVGPVIDPIAPFLRDLSFLTPATLVLTDLSISERADRYDLSVAGFSKADRLADFSAALDRFSSALKESAYRFTPGAPWRQEWISRMREGSRVDSLAGAEKSGRRFKIVGSMRK